MTTLPVLSLSSPLKMSNLPATHRRLDAVGGLARPFRHHRAVGRGLDEPFLQPAADEVRVRLAGLGRFDDLGVGGDPVPLGAGQVGVRGELGLAGVVTADELAALGRRLDDHLRAVDVHREDVDALVGQAVGGLGFLDRHRPVAGEDDLRGDGRVDRAGAHREGVDVAQHLRDRLGRDEAELLRLGHVAGDDAVEVLRLVDVAEEAAGVLRVLAFAPQAAAMGEAHVGVLARHRQHVRVEVAERGREQQRGAVLRDHALHGLLHGVGLGHVLFLDHLDASHLLHHGHGFSVRLVVAEVVLRTDVDEAERHRLLGQHQTGQTGGGQTGAGGTDGAQPVTAVRIRGQSAHGNTPAKG